MTTLNCPFCGILNAPKDGAGNTIVCGNCCEISVFREGGLSIPTKSQRKSIKAFFVANPSVRKECAEGVERKHHEKGRWG